ncbi:phosphopantetheine-binding protein [Thermobifida cellulosilytica]|uniref:Acyl carrier protein n=1 Tax=Thermobifida cellulosilytica TB100 TaxID=665004 RepID=A0A147KKA5_THECS|nr:phosphopantetheine-binding protein [Thermobifida cellulosilytica]KUP97724.1 acyl carrier protein [Thermobifida cellulosilytica TB100]
MTSADTPRSSVLTEQRVRDDVARLLGEPADTIDADENLLDRGLDSVRLMSLVESWRRDGINADFADLAEEPTITAWLARLSDQP